MNFVATYYICSLFFELCMLLLLTSTLVHCTLCFVCRVRLGMHEEKRKHTSQDLI